MAKKPKAGEIPDDQEQAEMADPFDSIPNGPATAPGAMASPDDLLPGMGPMDESFDTFIPEDALDGAYVSAAGIYKAQLTNLEKEMSSKGNPMWKWTFRVLEGEQAGKMATLFTALTPSAMWKLAETLGALGLGKPGERANFSRNDALGRVVGIDVVMGEYDGKPRTQLDKLIPIRGQDGGIIKLPLQAKAGDPALSA